MSITVRLICLVIGYAFGCIQSAFIIGKLVGKIDIRDYGSGNAGFTNTSRVLGAKAGISVFLLDLLKLIVAHTLCSLVFKGSGSFVSGASVLPGIYAGIGCVLGHNFPFYLNFKGGKGIACTLGLMLCVDWRVALATYVIGLVVFIAKKYISLASLTMALLYPILMIGYNLYSGGVFGYEAVILMFILCVLAYIKHKSNIERLINGNENKFRFGKKNETVKE
jgi:glycerol-3-phosphate acyltransferase PlsY